MGRVRGLEHPDHADPFLLQLEKGGSERWKRVDLRAQLVSDFVGEVTGARIYPDDPTVVIDPEKEPAPERVGKGGDRRPEALLRFLLLALDEQRLAMGDQSPQTGLGKVGDRQPPDAHLRHLARMTPATPAIPRSADRSTEKLWALRRSDSCSQVLRRM